MNAMILPGRPTPLGATPGPEGANFAVSSGGDELGRTQQGNNNAYCQDNEITWLDWSVVDLELMHFAKDLIALRRCHPVFRRRRYSTGKISSGPALVHAG